MNIQPFGKVFSMLVHRVGRQRSADVCGVSVKCVTNWGKGKPLPSQATQAGAVALLLAVSDIEVDEYEHIEASRFVEKCVINAAKC